MVRRHNRPSRSAPISEAEVALKWELQRLRKELAATRAKLSDGTVGGRSGADLTEDEVSAALLRMERITRRTVQSMMPTGAQCETCGGVSWYQFEQAMRAELRTRHIMMGAKPHTAPYEPDERPRPGYDDQAGRLAFRCIGAPLGSAP